MSVESNPGNVREMMEGKKKGWGEKKKKK